MATTQERLNPPNTIDATAHDDGPVQGRKRRIIIPIVAVLVIIGLIFGVRYLIYAAHHVSTDDAQINGDITTVAPRVKGQVTAVYVHENQSVRKGQLLLKLDDRDLQVAVLQAKAALSQAQASAVAAQEGVPLQAAVTNAQTSQAQAGVEQANTAVGSSQAGYVAAQQKVASAQAQVAAAHAGTVKALRDEQRAQSLVAQGAISQSDYDSYRAAAQAAQANEAAAQHNVDAAQAQASQASQALTQAQAGVSASAAQLEQAQTGNQNTGIKQAQAQTASAQVKAAQAAVNAAELQLSYATIYAPVDGVVSKKSVEVGDNVSVGQPLMAVAASSDLWVTANLKETQITNVRVGQPVEVKVDAYPGQTFTGKVQSLSPATGATFALIPPDNASGNFTKVVQRVPIRATIDSSSDPNHELRQGLSVEIAIDTTNH